MKISVFMLNVGQGDCVCIRYEAEGDEFLAAKEVAIADDKVAVVNKTTFTVLVDGGRRAHGAILYNFLVSKRYLCEYGIDLVVISHFHDDHYAGIERLCEMANDATNYPALNDALHNCVILSPNPDTIKGKSEKRELSFNSKSFGFIFSSPLLCEIDYQSAQMLTFSYPQSACLIFQERWTLRQKNL